MGQYLCTRQQLVKGSESGSWRGHLKWHWGPALVLSVPLQDGRGLVSPTPGVRDRLAQLQSRPGGSLMAAPQSASGHINQESSSGEGQKLSSRWRKRAVHWTLWYSEVQGGAAGGEGHGRPGLSPSPFHSVCAASFPPTSDGLLGGTGSLAAGSWRLRKPSSRAPEGRKLPAAAPGATRKHSISSSRDHVLTSLATRASSPSPPCTIIIWSRQKTGLAGLPRYAC